MGDIVVSKEKILHDKRFIYSCELRDQNGNAEQGVADISRVRGGLIEITGMSVGTGLDAIKIKGTTSRSTTATLQELPLNTVGAVGLVDVHPIGTAGVSVIANAVRENSFVRIPESLSKIQIALTGVTVTGVSAKFFGYSI